MRRKKNVWAFGGDGVFYRTFAFRRFVKDTFSVPFSFFFFSSASVSSSFSFPSHTRHALRNKSWMARILRVLSNCTASIWIPIFLVAFSKCLVPRYFPGPRVYIRHSIAKHIHYIQYIKHIYLERDIDRYTDSECTLELQNCGLCMRYKCGACMLVRACMYCVRLCIAYIKKPIQIQTFCLNPRFFFTRKLPILFNDIHINAWNNVLPSSFFLASWCSHYWTFFLL